MVLQRMDRERVQNLEVRRRYDTRARMALKSWSERSAQPNDTDGTYLSSCQIAIAPASTSASWGSLARLPPRSAFTNFLARFAAQARQSSSGPTAMDRPIPSSILPHPYIIAAADAIAAAHTIAGGRMSASTPVQSSLMMFSPSLHAGEPEALPELLAESSGPTADPAGLSGRSVYSGRTVGSAFPSVAATFTSAFHSAEGGGWFEVGLAIVQIEGGWINSKSAGLWMDDIWVSMI